MTAAAESTVRRATNTAGRLVVGLGGQVYALPGRSVAELTTVHRALFVPSKNPALLGIADVHGQLLPIVDLRPALALPTPPLTYPTLCLLLRTHAGPVVAPVDSVKGFQPLAFGGQKTSLPVLVPDEWIYA